MGLPGRRCELGQTGPTRLVWWSHEKRLPTSVRPSTVMMQTFSIGVVLVRRLKIGKLLFV